jgi:hypothetical protein
MNCKDAIELLGEYPRELVGAGPRADPPPEMPAEMKSRLRAFLLAQLLKGER